MASTFTSSLGSLVASNALGFSSNSFGRRQNVCPRRSRPAIVCAVKELHFNKDGSTIKKLQTGVNKFAYLFGVTLGPKGRNVVLESKYGSPKIANDGVTVAREVKLEDPVENIGAKLVRNKKMACKKSFAHRPLFLSSALYRRKGLYSLYIKLLTQVEKEVTKIRNSGTRTKTKMSNGGKFELGVASKGKRLCVTTNEGSSYQGIVETVLFMEQCCCFVTTQFQYSDIKEMKYEVALNEKIDSRDNAVEDPVENIGAKLVPAGNPMDKGSLDESS